MLARIGLGVAALILPASSAIAQAGDDSRAQWRTGSEAEVDWGVGVRARYVGVPRGVLELFVDEASSGVAHPGFGLEVIRRRGGFELIFGVEVEDLSPDDGLWLDKGDTPPEETPDFVEFSNDFGWVTADVAFVWHRPVHEIVALRYGGGFGVGIVRGEFHRTDTDCTGTTTDTCTPISEPEEGRRFEEKEDPPPVFPVVSALVGAQIRPLDKLSINVEAGIRSVAYAGTSVSYFF